MKEKKTRVRKTRVKTGSAKRSHQQPSANFKARLLPSIDGETRWKRKSIGFLSPLSRKSALTVVAVTRQSSSSNDLAAVTRKLRNGASDSAKQQRRRCRRRRRRCRRRRYRRAHRRQLARARQPDGHHLDSEGPLRDEERALRQSGVVSLDSSFSGERESERERRERRSKERESDEDCV